jgi:hypothetical protein
MIENGINTAPDIGAAVRYYELSVDDSNGDAFHLGHCCESGRGVSIDLTVAVELFRKAAVFGDADSVNSFGCCLERGKGVDQNIELTVEFYPKAAFDSHPSGLSDFRRCLEYGLGIERDLVRAAKYYGKGAELGNPTGQNSFRVFLERGIGIVSNQALAAHYFELSGMQDDRDGANNLGFCFEHGRGIHHNIESATEWYRFASDQGHPEAEGGFRCCLRFFSDWSLLDRCSSISDNPHWNDLSEKFLTAVEDCVAADEAGAELVAWTKRLKSGTVECVGPRAELIDSKLAQGNSKVVLTKDCERFWAVTTAIVSGTNESIQSKIAILKKMNHLLVVRIREPLSRAPNCDRSVVTKFVENGSLADQLLMEYMAISISRTVQPKLFVLLWELFSQCDISNHRTSSTRSEARHYPS